VADKEEVEPTEGSSAAGSSDAADSVDPVASAGDPDVERALDDDNDDGPSGTEPDEFDEIVRGSDFGGAHALGSDRDGVDDDVVEGDIEDKALEPAGVGAAAAGAGVGAVAERQSGRRPKEAATRPQDEPVKGERTGPVKFVRESVGELRKVVYPTGQQLINYFVVVLVFVLFIIAYVSLLDLGLGAAIFRIFS